MKRLLQMVLPVVVFAQAALAADLPVVTRWMDPSGKPRPSHIPAPGKGLLKLVGESPTAARGFIPPGIETNRICVIVHSNVYASISNSLVQYETDLAEAGFSVVRYRYDSGTAGDLRTYLRGLYEEGSSLKGVVLIGEVPYVLYEMIDDFGYGPSGYESFPCDVFYMDLDGTWEDSQSVSPFSAGIYDSRSGDLDLEIWACRLKTANLPSLGSQTNLLNAYFDKNHRYRAGKLAPCRRALAYVDDDWASSLGSEDAEHLSWLYRDVHTVSVIDPLATVSADYKTNRMVNSYEFFLIRSHGWSGGHSFSNGTSGYQYIYSSDYRARTPPALFFIFYVCSGSDFTASDNLAGTATFNANNSGLLSWGSTKTGGSYYEGTFFEALAGGEPFGEAFRLWFNELQSWGYSWFPSWFYGMVLIGDGALKPNAAMPTPTNLSAVADAAVTSWGALRDSKYSLQYCDNLVHAAWSNEGSVFTADSYSVARTGATAGVGCRMYRLVEDLSGPSNLLTNGSFEMPGSMERYARYWSWGEPDTHGSIWSNAYRETWRARRGLCEAVVRGSWSDAATSGGWWQEAPASAGATYRASAWFWADKGGYGGVWTAAVQELKIEFYSGSFGPALDTNTVDLSDVGESWTQKTVAAVAPASTAWARFVVGVSGAGSQGGLQFDDAELVKE